MIAIDTNILLRYIVQDDAKQSLAAGNLLEELLSPSNPGFISTIVVCELFWAMKNTYDLSQDIITRAVEQIVDAPQLILENGQIVKDALSTGHPDLADALIHLAGTSNGCSQTVTFDRKFARLEGVELLK